jgi:methionyl-tRNA formyltransferase
MNLVFMGSPDFAIPCFERLLNGPHQVRAVVTVPDKPAGRGKQLTASSVKQKALLAGLDVLQPDSLSDIEFLSMLKSYEADLFVVVAFRVLPAAVFKMPARGVINLHASLLPQYRGAAPINWVLINGEKETGVSTFFIEEKVDTGNILLQRRMVIPDDMIAGELYEALGNMGADVLLETINGLQENRLVARPQVGSVTAAPKIHKELGCLDWTQSTQKIYNLFRGLSPIPGVYSHHHSKLFKFQKIRPGIGPVVPGFKPGSVVEIDPGNDFSIATVDGIVRILRLQPEGKRVMSAGEFLRGYPLAVGDLFTSAVI